MPYAVFDYEKYKAKPFIGRLRCLEYKGHAATCNTVIFKRDKTLQEGVFALYQLREVRDAVNWLIDDITNSLDPILEKEVENAQHRGDTARPETGV